MSTEIKTKHLVIRPYEPKDFEHSVRIYGDEKITKYFDFGKARSRQEIEVLVKKLSGVFKQGEVFGLFSVFLKSTQEFVGHIDFLSVENQVSLAEIGVIFSEKFHGQGLALEAMSAFINQQVPRSNIQKIMVTAHPENHASIKLIEKLGMTFEKELIRFGQPRREYFLDFFQV